MTSPALPTGFETKKKAEEFRLKVLETQQANGLSLLPETCTSDEPCGSGLCPLCTRRDRRKLLKLLYREGLTTRSWFFVTIYVDGWMKPPGDVSPFGELKGHPIIKQLLQRFRRAGAIIVFGSIETVYLVVENVLQGKPFHLHLMVMGLTEAEIDAEVRASVPLDECVRVPLQIKEVNPTASDFCRTASYAFKQPFWKNSYGTRKHRQFPNKRQLYELISHLGAHRSRDRLILLGIRWYGDLPQLTSTVKSRLRPP
jgi:hypothetical protein